MNPDARVCETLLLASSGARADFRFGVPRDLGSVVNSSSSDGSPEISADGLTLYFDSGRPGGQGDWDIWMTTVHAWRRLGYSGAASVTDQWPVCRFRPLRFLRRPVAVLWLQPFRRVRQLRPVGQHARVQGHPLGAACQSGSQGQRLLLRQSPEHLGRRPVDVLRFGPSRRAGV